MRRMWMTAAALAIALAAAGCGHGNRAGSADRAAVSRETPAPEPAAPASGQSGRMLKAPDEVPAASVTLSGTVGCGHCTFGVTDDCALAMKTGDGKIYVVANDPENDAHMGERFSGKAITVTGRVERSADGGNVIHAEKVDLR